MLFFVLSALAASLTAVQMYLRPTTPIAFAIGKAMRGCMAPVLTRQSICSYFVFDGETFHARKKIRRAHFCGADQVCDSGNGLVLFARDAQLAS